MTRYRLPDALGGGEVEADETWGGCPGGRPEYRVKDSHITITMPEGTPMEAVKPPLPEEPNASVVQIGPVAFIRDQAGWLCADGRYSWSELNDIAAIQVEGIVPLVPDPFAEPVALPWKFNDGSRRAKVDRGGGGVSIYLRDQHDDAVHLNWTPEVACNAARALWAAAAEELPEWERELLEGQR